MAAVILPCAIGAGMQGESSVPCQLCYQAVLCASFGQHGTSVALPVCKPPALCLLPAAPSGSVCITRAVFYSCGYKNNKPAFQGCLGSLLRCYRATGWLRLEGTSKPTQFQCKAVGWVPSSSSSCPGPPVHGLRHLQAGGTHSSVCSPTAHQEGPLGLCVLRPMGCHQEILTAGITIVRQRSTAGN